MLATDLPCVRCALVFRTPLPNTKLWSNPAIGLLNSQDAISTGGWWHDVRILQATGRGMDQEEPRAWEGWWNETVVDLVRLSQQQPDALNVLLTGRAETGFGDVIQRMVASKKLDFAMVVLKPAVGPQNERFKSTMDFKQVFLTALMQTYAAADEIRIYEDRPKHVQGFRDFLADYNARQPRALAADVVHVTEMTSVLDPVTRSPRCSSCSTATTRPVVPAAAAAWPSARPSSSPATSSRKTTRCAC